VSETINEVKSLRRQNRELKRFLLSLATVIADAVNALDVEMKKPPTREHGRRIAAINNILEYANDSAMHFGLKMGFPAMKRLKNRLPSVKATRTTETPRDE
jgi:hypothetical protein